MLSCSDSPDKSSADIMENNVGERIQEVGSETILETRVRLHSETHKTVNTTFDAVIKQIGALYILINGNWPVDNSRLPTPQFYESHCTCKRNFQGTVLI